MKGFELNLNGKKFQATLENGIVSIILIKHDDLLSLDFRWLNTQNENYDEMIDWFQTELKMNDEIIIKIKDISQNSEPIKIQQKEKKTDKKK